MDTQLDRVIASIEKEYKDHILKGGRHYLEVNIAQQAAKLGYEELDGALGDSHAIVPPKRPHKGMKVRIDGRTFVNYAEYESGVAVPGYVARRTGRKYRTLVPLDSMICNFT